MSTKAKISKNQVYERTLSIKIFISIISRQKQNVRYGMVNPKEYVDFVERIPIIIYGK